MLGANLKRRIRILFCLQGGRAGIQSVLVLRQRPPFHDRQRYLEYFRTYRTNTCRPPGCHGNVSEDPGAHSYHGLQASLVQVPWRNSCQVSKRIAARSTGLPTAVQGMHSTPYVEYIPCLCRTYVIPFPRSSSKLSWRGAIPDLQ